MKTKEQTDAEILEGASKDNDEISEIRVRHTDSVHPLDCSCDLCLELRNQYFSSKKEDEVKEELEWFNE